jgi:hypothetical protein
MRNWNFSPGRSLTLTLAADARLCHTSYINDQIWELRLGNSEPPVISLETTFGLRARLCRIFPRFVHDGKTINDPEQFSSPIIIHQYFPNYIQFSFRPFSHINVRQEYWVPESQVIAGRTILINTSKEPCDLQLVWVELLLASADGSRMADREIGMKAILAGKTGDLAPVFFLNGEAQSGKSSYPSLTNTYQIPPHSQEETRWVHVALADIDSSYILAKEIIKKDWTIEFSRIKRLNSTRLEIITGNKDWDTVFFISQNIAQQLIQNPINLPVSNSFVTSRNSEQGYSLRKDGSDYDHFWNGQTPLETYYLLNYLLPVSPDLVKDILDNFLKTQIPSGEIDWKPGIAGQRSHILATPLLSEIAIQLYEHTGDLTYIGSIFPKLLAFFKSWFSKAHDRDGDQIPEWDQMRQIGFDDLPLFSQDHLWSAGLDITTVESPDLCSFLFNECNSLLKIAKLLNCDDESLILGDIAEKLKAFVEQSWNEQSACYLYQDRDIHISPTGMDLGIIHGSGVLDIHQEFQVPIRPIIKIETKKDATRPTRIFIHGSGVTGSHRVEQIPATKIRWHVGYAYVTSDFTYRFIEQIEINGVQPDDLVRVYTGNLTSMDQSLLLPLWAGIPPPNRAKILINLSLFNKKKFLSAHGIRTSTNFLDKKEYPENYYGIFLPWTSLILQGLLKYGERKKSSEIFTRLLKTIIRSHQNNMVLHQSFHSENGKPLGAQNTLSSLIPIGVFLEIAGIKIRNSSKIELSGHNPFPWPVTVKYQGMTVVKSEKKTLVVFPDGQNMTVDNDQQLVISREEKTVSVNSV